MKQKDPKPGGMTCETALRAIALSAMSSIEASAPDQEFPDDLYGVSRDPVIALPGEPRTLRSANLAGPPELPHLKQYPDLADDGDVPHRAPGSVPPSADHRIPDGSALAQHLWGCPACRAEAAATDAFFRALASDHGPEPSASLLARARVQLDATLDSCEQSSLWTRFMQQVAFTAGRLRAAPALASALLLAGLLAGGYGGYRAGNAAHAAEQTTLLLAPPPPEAPSVVADVTSVSRDPGNGMVEIHYDRLVPDVLTAGADDPSIRELLMAGTENGIDPQVRNIAVNLLSGSCHVGAPCTGALVGTPVRTALLNALATDKTPEVRREALAGLQPFIADDTEARDAVMTALMSDPSASVRIEAVRLLQPVDVDSSVRQVLHTVASHDGDPLIRSASLAALRSVPQVQ